MKITIDNLDGRGALDYTSAVSADGPLTLQRTLSAPSRCTTKLFVHGGLTVPVRHARVIVTNDAGTTLFTGYVATSPVQEYAGEGAEGPLYTARLSTISDEWLLDKAGSGAQFRGGLALQQTAGEILGNLSTRVLDGATVLALTSTAARTTGAFAPQPTAPWSTNANAAAGAAYSTYRAMANGIIVQNAGATTHNFTDADGSLAVAELATTNIRELANDVTVTGAMEPAALITEVFTGDGTTTAFELSEAAFRGTNRTLLRDSFNQPAIDRTQWTLTDPGAHVSLTSAGLTVNGGNGTLGATTLTAIDAIELGGSIVAELGGVQFGALSDGILGGFYNGAALLTNCFVGFRVRQNSGVTVMVPLLNGAEVGTVFTPTAGHSYTLRLRLHCVEQQRVQQVYYAMVDGVVETFGSPTGINAPMDVVFELIDEGAASNTPTTVLYDSAATLRIGGIVSTPATCSFAAVNSANLVGSIASINVTRPGSLYVFSQPPSGALQTRLIGPAGTGCDCEATYGTAAGTPGKVTFFAGRVPVAGETITVLYRNEQRAVARLQDAASVAAEAASEAAGGLTGTPGTARWLGKVLAPPTRSSADCENAAQAILAFSTARSAAIAGSYTTLNPAADIWPGDILAITSSGVTSSFLIRSVVVEDGHGIPEIATYKLKFANDWATEFADGLGLKLSEAIATDAFLPQAAATAPAQVLANLQQVSVTSISTTSISLAMNFTPPIGGGFEVRRRDWSFGTNVDTADLVLRSPVANFSLPRAAQVERFYIRTYDASTPPLYSRFSAAVFVNAPV